MIHPASYTQSPIRDVAGSGIVDLLPVFVKYGDEGRLSQHGHKEGESQRERPKVE